MKLVLDGQMVNYTDEGKGNVVLFLHGWGANLRSFDKLADEMSQHYRVIRIDFPAFGGSSRPPRDWDIGDYAEFVNRFLQKKEITHLKAVIAHSFGGRVTIKLAGEKKVPTDKIILIGSGGINHSSSPRQQAYKVVAKTGKRIMRLPGLHKLQNKMRRRLYETAGAMDYFDADDDMQKIFLKVINEDVRQLAASITIPTLLIWGENDTETPVADGEIFHEKISGSKFVVIADAGHFTYLDQPEKVTAEIKTFLQ